MKEKKLLEQRRTTRVSAIDHRREHTKTLSHEAQGEEAHDQTYKPDPRRLLPAKSGRKEGTHMDTTGSDRFALEAFSLAFCIQRILQSRLIPPEAKERLAQTYSKLKEQVTLLNRLQEDQERAQKMSQKN